MRKIQLLGISVDFPNMSQKRRDYPVVLQTRRIIFLNDCRYLSCDIVQLEGIFIGMKIHHGWCLI